MKKMTVIFMICLLVAIGCLPIYAEADGMHPERLVDQADLLDEYEEEVLKALLDETSEELNFDIVIVTTDTTDGKSTVEYADDFFDYNGYGMGDDYDGALLLINMLDREWYISTTGRGIQAMSDSDIEEIGDNVAYYLSYGEYQEAFEEFVWQVEWEVENYSGGAEDSFVSTLLLIPICMIAGCLLAFIPVTIMKRKMNNVAMKDAASDYLKHDRTILTEQRDMFLYRTIHRTARPKNEGSSSHRGSSGRSHGGGGGRF